ncbi:NusA-like transcription termination signal-binding factor [Candidatus Woesearchaeota archaeon]|nr:NusA-like transcription termination signal-binding factor [Candidatus Woesearchaeota archaeon]
MRQILTRQEIDYINAFEGVTHVPPKNCFLNGEALFIVMPGKGGRAIGKRGTNVSRLAKMLRKKIRIVEFDDDPLEFIANLIAPIKGKIYKSSEQEICIEVKSVEKAYIIGRDRHRLKYIQRIVAHYFPIIIKVV